MPAVKNSPLRHAPIRRKDNIKKPRLDRGFLIIKVFKNLEVKRSSDTH